ncbi:MAG TPA: RICIN domain-containing protein, partial [Streptomyces sp.]|nr:RICIN domain-containing protein [Streptomyces sp.]
MTLLLTRHQTAVSDYAAIWAASPHAASLLTTAAFAKVLEAGPLSEGGIALRPQLLSMVRRIAASWYVDPRIPVLMPDLRKPADGRNMLAGKVVPPQNRRLAFRAFQEMPGAAQCLLWHTEAEAEDISRPSELLGLDPGTAQVQLEHARGLFRQGLLRGHIELAQEKECRHYNRLLDVSMRRGGILMPDVERHLSQCRHCRFAAEQLGLFHGRLPVLLAEALLGRSARRYLDSRPGRRGTLPQHGTSARRTGRHSGAGRRHLLARAATPTERQRVRTGAATGLAVLVAGLLVVNLASGLWSDGDDYKSSSHESTIVPSTPPVASPTMPGASAPPPDSAVHPSGTVHTALRNAASGLCLDIPDGRTKVGASVTTATCTDSETQLWLYEDDGLLRSFPEPHLCLNSRAADGTAVLSDCPEPTAKDAANTRYDLT